MSSYEPYGMFCEPYEMSYVQYEFLWYTTSFLGISFEFFWFSIKTFDSTSVNILPIFYLTLLRLVLRSFDPLKRSKDKIF